MQAREFVDSIVAGTPLASPGKVKDPASGGEPLWLSIAKGDKQVADVSFPAAGGTVNRNWAYVKFEGDSYAVQKAVAEAKSKPFQIDTESNEMVTLSAAVAAAGRALMVRVSGHQHEWEANAIEKIPESQNPTWRSLTLIEKVRG